MMPSMCGLGLGLGLETDDGWKKRQQQQAKSRRLLERMAPELEAAKKKLQSSPWSKVSYFPRGGVLHPAQPKLDRQEDVRRIPESFPRELGWRTVKLDDGPANFGMRVRRMIGNRNGSVKALKLRKKIRQPARNVLKHMARLESMAEISAMKELERERQIEIAQLFEDEGGANFCAVHPLFAREPQGLPAPNEKSQESGYYPYYY